jgi:hypothetical protein
LGRQEVTTRVVMRAAAAELVVALTLILFGAPLVAEAQEETFREGGGTIRKRVMPAVVLGRAQCGSHALGER